MLTTATPPVPTAPAAAPSSGNTASAAPADTARKSTDAASPAAFAQTPGM